MTILSFDPERRTNAQAVAELATLGLCPEPVIDLTYGRGKFWTQHRPADLTTNDLRTDADLCQDYREPWPVQMRHRFSTVVFDPPYKLNGTPTDDDRYGVDEPATLADRLRDFEIGLEHARTLVAPGGFLWVKYMDQVACGRMQWQSDLVRDVLSAYELTREARMFVHTGARPQRSQVRARNNYSTLEVWRPGSGTKEKADMPRCQASEPETGQRCIRTDNLDVSHKDGWHKALAPDQLPLKVDPTAGCIQDFQQREYIRWPLSQGEGR